MNDAQLFESLKQIQHRLGDAQAIPGLSETHRAIEQAITAYHQLKELCEEINHSQNHLNELAQQANLSRSLYAEAINVINLNITQIQSDQDFTSQGQQDLEVLKKSLGALEKLVNNILVNNVGVVIQEKPNVLGQANNLEHIVDRISLAQKKQQAWEQRRGKCLIIDENPNAAESLQRRLAHEGYEAFTVSDLETAKKTLLKDNIDVILVDVEAARSAYGSLITQVIEGNQLGYIPVVVVGTLNQFDELSRLLESGVEDFLIKPMNSILLKSRIRTSIEKKDAYELRQERVRESERLRAELHQAITELTECFIAFDQNHRLLMHNERVFDFFPSLKTSEIVGASIEAWLGSLVESGVIDLSKYKEGQQQWFAERLQALASPASVWKEYLLTGQVLQVTSYRTADGGTVVILKDDTENRSNHERLTYMAYHDVLTGLANREQFYDRLKQAIVNPASLRQGFAVLFMDLDGFKTINDTNGHDVGDWLLTQVAQRLRNSMRDQDIVARFGGDEFAALIHNVSKIEMVKPILERILSVVATPVPFNHLKLRVGISIGVSLYPHHSLDLETLVSQADAAMYAAKQAGRMAYRFYEPTFTGHRLALGTS